MDEAPRLERAYVDEDCGCSVEHWLFRGIDLTIHFEADGTMEVFADTGAWDHDFALTATTMAAAREETFAWVRALPVEN